MTLVATKLEKAILSIKAKVTRSLTLESFERALYQAWFQDFSSKGHSGHRLWKPKKSLQIISAGKKLGMGIYRR